MKHFFLLFVILILYFIPSLENTQLDEDYPFSIRLGYNEAITFMNNKVVELYNKTEPTTYLLEEDCKTFEEKGAIYLDGYYYLSCLESGGFQIKVFKRDDTNLRFTLYKNYVDEDSSFFTLKSGSSIRFFIKNSGKVLVVAAWIDNSDNLRIVELDIDAPKYVGYSVTDISNNLDCIYLSKYQRIFCGYAIKLNDERYNCGFNIFDGENLGALTDSQKIFNTGDDCVNHLSTKLRGPTDILEDSDIFYYYFVGLDYNAYVSKCTMISSLNVNCLAPVIILIGCDYIQNTFDLAEDKFLGYNVLTCVDRQFHTKIKIQLFKFDDGNNVVFYEDKTVNDNKDITLDSEVSMVNFVVLSKDNNIGYLTYRLRSQEKSYYLLFTQPTCSPITKNNNHINSPILIPFKNVIDDNKGDCFYTIISYDSGIKIDDENLQGKNDIYIEVYNFTKSIVELKYKIGNGFFESEICTVKISVKECYDTCQTCDSKGNDFFDQKCITCKEGYNQMKFPTNYGSGSGIINCCKKLGDGDDSCPNYLYEDDSSDPSIFKICQPQCTTCDGGTANNCLSCYNSKSLAIFSDEEKDKISSEKGIFYYFNSDQECVTEDDCLAHGMFVANPDEDDTCQSCFTTCKTCEGPGDINNNNCKECSEEDDYYFLGNSQNCKLEEEGYYKDNTVTPQRLKPCHSSCKSCKDSNSNTNCLECKTGFHPKCSEKDNTIPHECFFDAPDNYFLENDCYIGCHSSCKTCDGPADDTDEIKNCLSCGGGKILFNKKCISDCDLPYKKLRDPNGNEICVLECPSYTIDETNVCHNCKEDRQYKYMGTALTDVNKGKCLDDEEFDNIKSFTFIANENYNILDDCYELCDECYQRGTSTQMNCKKCLDPDEYSLAEGIGNCMKSGEPLDYYYETTDENDHSVFKKCYETCKTCERGGNILTHNCTSCKEGYQFDPNTKGNCVVVCPYYWYVDSTTKEFTCTEEEKCPEDKPYFIEVNQGCVEECSEAQHNIQRFFYRYKKTCITQCPENSMRDDLLYVCHTLEDVKDIFVYGSNYIKQSIGAVNNLLLYSEDNTKLFHLFNTSDLGMKTYKNNSFSVGTSIIDLSNCLNTLRHINGYSESEVFYIGVLDIIREDTSAPQFEYTIFNHLGKQLDINFCKTNELVIEKSLNQSTHLTLAKNVLENYGYDIIDYQKNNKFFCDICSIFDYDKLDAYDVLLDDRYKYYYEDQNYYFCEDTCKAQSTYVDLKSLRVKCVCSGKTNFTNYKKQSFQKYEKFSQNCRDEFLQFFKCGKNVFTKELFTKNVGNYFTFFFIIFQIGDVFLFYFYSKKPMMSHINDVLVKRAKKGYENDSESGSESISQSQSQSQSESRKSGSYSENRSGSGSRGSGEGSQSGSRRDDYSQSGSQSGSKRQSQSGSQNESEEGSHEENENGSQSGSQSGSQQSGTVTVSKRSKSKKNSSNPKGSKTGSKTSKANPPKSEQENKKEDNKSKDKEKEKTKFAFVTLDNKEEEEKNKPELTTEDNFLKIEIPNNEDEQISAKEDEKEKSINTNKKAPNPAWKKYAKRYLNDGHNYVDNSYREDSYNFDIPKSKKNNSDDSSSNEESEKDSNNISSKKDDNNSNINPDNNKVSTYNRNSQNNDLVSKPKKNKNGKIIPEELPPAAVAPVKTDLEKFNDEIKKFEKFSFIELYWFILRKKHRLISLLIKKDIYDIFSIKLSLLILSYTIDFFITTLFFFNFEIKKLFHLKQHIEPVYIIFMGLFCTLLSTALIKIIDYLMEYRTDFRRYEILQKYENDHSNYFSSLNGMIKGFNQKMIIYYIVMFVFSTFSWYMVSAFIATYFNTKLIWGIMIGINFGLSNIFPFIYYFFGVLFQYKGIHSESYKMYKLGIVMIKI